MKIKIQLAVLRPIQTSVIYLSDLGLDILAWEALSEDKKQTALQNHVLENFDSTSWDVNGWETI